MEINYNIKYAIDAHKDFVPILCIIGDGKWETLKKWMFILFTKFSLFALHDPLDL